MCGMHMVRDRFGPGVTKQCPSVGLSLNDSTHGAEKEKVYIHKVYLLVFQWRVPLA